jgi:putative transposase
MTATPSIDMSVWVDEHLGQASPDLLRNMIKTFAEVMMSAEADAVCGAVYGTVSDDRVNRCNGYRERPWDTRAGTIEWAVPKLREGTYFPQWLLRYRRRAEAAMVWVVATSYLLGVSTRRMEKLVANSGSNRSPSRRCRRWRCRWTRRLPRFVAARWMPGRTRSLQRMR